MVSSTDHFVSADAAPSAEVPAPSVTQPGLLQPRVRPVDRRRNKRPLTVDRKLTPEDHAEYDRFLVDRRTTIQMAFDWLKARGYDLKFGAVYRHRKTFLRDYAEEEFWARVAERSAFNAQRNGRTVMADGVVSTFERLLLAVLREMGRGKAHPPASARRWPGQCIRSSRPATRSNRSAMSTKIPRRID